MPHTIDALEFLAHPEKHPPAPVCAVFGDEAFLRRQAIEQLRHLVLGSADAEFSLTRFAGDTVGMREVLDELSTVALFGAGRRLVVVDDADDFVSEHRGALEDYVARPKTTGVLVLEVSTWPKTTRLYKALDASGLQIDCKTPTERAIVKWLTTWAKQRHQAKLDTAAAEAMLDLVGPELGLLDQELAKLSVSVQPAAPIGVELVEQLVGGWRAKTAWDMIDAALAGKPREALGQLDRLLLAGENAIGLLAQIASNLRRLAAATRLIEQGEARGKPVGLRQALEQAGVRSFVVAKAEQQLRHLGRQRGSRVYRWLLQADLDLKGASSLPPRVVLERLIVRLATPPARAVTR